VDRITLEQLLGDGLSLAEIGRRFDRHEATVAYWAKKYGLEAANRAKHAARGGVAEDELAPLAEAGLSIATLCCSRHGDTDHCLDNRGYFRCKRCRTEAVTRRRRTVKEILVNEAGGRCQLCGYDRYIGALEFHHLDPATKNFGLSIRGLTPAIAALRVEAQKCVLLCSNCHAEVEGGVASIPA
jgi:hypothetical protein